MSRAIVNFKFWLSIFFLVSILGLIVLFFQSRYYPSDNSVFSLPNSEWYKTQFPLVFNEIGGVYYLQCTAGKIKYDTIQINKTTIIHAFVPCTYLNANKTIEKVYIPISFEFLGKSGSNWRFLGGKNGFTLFENNTFTQTNIINITSKRFSDKLENKDIIVTLGSPKQYSFSNGLEYLNENFKDVYSEDTLKSFSKSGISNALKISTFKKNIVILPIKVSEK